METTSDKRIYQILLIASALVLLAKSYEITFGVWFVVAAISIRNRYSLGILKLLAIPALILSVSFVSSFFYEYIRYNFFRDLAYLLKPIMGMLIGYNFAKLLGPKILDTIIYAGVALAVIHIGTLAFYYVFVGIRDMNMLRLYGGYFDDLEIYVLILLIFRERLQISISRDRAWAAIAVVGISSVFYLARTNIIQFFILFFAMKGYLRVTPKSIRVLSMVVIGVLLSYSAIYYYNPKRQGQGLDGFLYKVKIAPIEPFKTYINADDWKDWNDNYRSFENIITVRQVSYQGWPAVFFGKGMGSTIDLGRELWTNDEEFIRYLPTLHNAYMTVFLKSGLLGVAFLLYFIYLLYRHEKSDDEKIKHLNFLLVGSAAYLILSNWVFMGLYLKLDNKSIVLGAIWAYREMLIQRQRQQIKQNASN